MGTERELIASAAGILDRWYLGELLGLVAIVLAVPAVLRMMQMLRERYIAAGPVGAGLAMMRLLPSRA